MTLGFCRNCVGYVECDESYWMIDTQLKCKRCGNTCYHIGYEPIKKEIEK